MKKFFTFCLSTLFLMFSIGAIGQDDAKKDESPWKTGGDASLTFLSSSFSSEWSAKDGGENNITVGALANGFAKYKKDKLSWDNNLLAQYTSQRTAVNPDFVKTLDKLELLSLAGYEAVNNWYYSMALSAKTQWTPTQISSFSGTRDSVVSSFFAPGQILIGPGMKYSKGDKKSKLQVAMNVSPATAKFIIIRDQEVADASYNGDNFQTEFGASVLGTVRYNIRENITYQTNIELFSNYLNNPQFVDVKWANIISTNILKIITINFTYDVRYDNDISEKVRTASTLGVGLGYKF